MRQNYFSFGQYIRYLREKDKMPLRKVAASLDIDPSSLSKIERGERQANLRLVALMAEVFNVEEHSLRTLFLSEKVAYEILGEKSPKKILQAAEQRVKYLKRKIND